MSKKDNIDSFDTSHKSLYISLAVLFPIMFLVAFVIFYLIETILLSAKINVQNKSNKKIVKVGTFSWKKYVNMKALLSGA